MTQIRTSLGSCYSRTRASRSTITTRKIWKFKWYQRGNGRYNKKKKLTCTPISGNRDSSTARGMHHVRWSHYEQPRRFHPSSRLVWHGKRQCPKPLLWAKWYKYMFVDVLANSDIKSQINGGELGAEQGYKWMFQLSAQERIEQAFCSCPLGGKKIQFGRWQVQTYTTNSSHLFLLIGI